MSQHSLVKLVFNGTWLVKTGNGEYLDMVPDGESGAHRLVSVPISRVRHAFRLQRLQDVRTREWTVTLEPVPLTPALAPAPAISDTTLFAVAAPMPLQLPMQLAHHGCLNFGLKPSTTHVRPDLLMASPTMLKGTQMVGDLFEGLPEGTRELSLDMHLLTLAFTASTVNFPSFEGEAARAFDYIAAQLGFDPHSYRLDEAALAGLERPDDIASAAWKEVTHQLRQEIHYRFLCRQHFDALTRFVQNVFIANTNLVETVGSLIRLDGNQIVHIVIGGLFSAVASGVGALPFPGSGVVSGGLKVAFQVMLRDRGPSEADLTVALMKARDGLADLFNDLISAVQKLETGVSNDWGKLQEMGKSLERDDGAYQWPEDDGKMREEARRQMEISLWKNLLKAKWHHMTADDDPGFLARYSDANKAAYEQANPHYWVNYWAGTQSDLFGKKTNGFYISYHWLGYGSQALWHHEPDRAMCDRLFNTLKVPRSEVFTDTSWGLAPETFHVYRPVPMM